MRVKGRYQARSWVRPWMVYASFYVIHFFGNLRYLHKHTKADTKDTMWEWTFPQTQKAPPEGEAQD